MKKIVLTLVALMSMTMTFAENEGMNTTEAYNMTVNMKMLARKRWCSLHSMVKKSVQRW